MFEHFTDRARKVMALANQEAQRFNHEYIDTEHILLGLVKEGSGVGATVLKNLDVDIKKLRREVEKLVKSGPGMVTMGKLPQTPGAKKVIEYAIEEARALNHNYVGTQHILLGLLRESEGIAAQALRNLGLKPEDVRQEVLNLLGAGGEDAPRAEGVPPSARGQDVRDTPGAPVNYRNLPVWQKADELAHQVYAATGGFPQEDVGGVAARLRWVTLTVPAQIAEMYERHTPAETRWFLNIIRSLLQEVLYLLNFSLERQYLAAQEHQKLKDLADDVRRELQEHYE